MPRLTTIVSLFIAAIVCASMFAANTQPTVKSIGKMPLAFTKNMGQWDDRVLFRANAGGATMWFTKDAITYQFTRRIPSPPSPLPEGEGWSQTGEREMGHSREGGNPASVGRTFLSDPGQAGMPILPGDRYEKDSIEQLVLTAKFIDANPNTEIIAEGQLEYKCNYFLGNDPTKWHTDVPNYEAITLKDIYPGIDLKYSGDGTGQAEYEFIAAPGADIAQIKVEYEGAEETSLDSDGKMILKTKWGDMIAAIKTPANGVLSGTRSFSQLSEKTIGFEAGGANQQALGTQSVGLVYSTYLGGGSGDYGNSIAVDDSGNAYVTGYTNSTNFPTTPGAYDSTYNGGYDAFVAKFSPTGALIYSTYLGGGGDDRGNGIAVDSSGCAYVTGSTDSWNFPMQAPYQWDQVLVDVFVTKISSTGNSLIYSTYLGGGRDDYGNGIAVDGSGYAYVTGWTQSSNFPTLNPYQATFRGSDPYFTPDAFVTKLSSTGNSLIYSTYLGGGSGDYGYGIAVDGSGYAFVTGMTEESDFPTLNPYQTYQGGGDVFVTKLSSSGSSLIYSTYLGGGEGADFGYGIAVDDGGNAYVTGWTGSSNFPTLNPYQTYQGSSDVFVTKLSSSGNSLVYSTYLGGGSEDLGHGIAVDVSGYAYVTGYTASSNFPTLNPFQTYQGSDAFVTKLSSAGNSLIYSTHLGGGGDYGHDIAVDGSGYAYVTGYTASPNFPTLNPYQATFHGGDDAFVTKLDDVSIVPMLDPPMLNELSPVPSLTGSFQLSWSRVAAGDGYRFEWVSDSLFSYATGFYIATSNSDTSYTVGCLSQGTRLWFRVRATKSDQPPSDWSNVVSSGVVDYTQGMPFATNPNGWQFINAYENVWPEEWWSRFDYFGSGSLYSAAAQSWFATKGVTEDYFPDWPLYAQTLFGSGCCNNTAFLPKIVALERWLAFVKSRGYYWDGSGTGFAVTSLFFFDNVFPLSDAYPGYFALFSVPAYGGIPADPNFYEINKYWLNHLKPAYMSYFLQQNAVTKPSQTVQLIAAMFADTSRSADRYLILDDHLGSDYSHAVIPIHLVYDGCGPNTARIYIYDNSANPPTQTPYVTVNLNNDTWSYTTPGNQNVGGSLGLYLSEPIGVYKDFANYKRMPNDTTTYPVEVFAPHRSNVVIQLENGDSLGYVNGELFLPTDLSAAVPIVPISEHQSWPIAYDINDSPFTSTIANTRDTAYSIAVFRDSTMLAVTRGLLPSGATDDVSCRPVDRLLTVTNGSAMAGNYGLEALFGAGTVELRFTIRNLTMGPADSCRLQIVNSEAIRMVNYGDSTSYDLTIDATNADSSSTFAHFAIPFGAGSAHGIYANVQDDSIVSVIVYVDADNNGIVDDTLTIDNQPAHKCGDADGEGTINIADAVFLIAYIFSGGPAPVPLAAGDADCDGVITIADAVYLIEYIFSHGPAPCAECG